MGGFSEYSVAGVFSIHAPEEEDCWGLFHKQEAHLISMKPAGWLQKKTPFYETSEDKHEGFSTA